MTQRRLTIWSGRAYELWLEHGGRFTLNHCLDATRPALATEDDRRSALAYTIASTSALHDAIMEAIQ